MNPFDTFPPEVAMTIAKMTSHPLADIMKQYREEKRKQEMDEEDCEDTLL